MHGHERRIVKEVLSNRQSLHMLYRGARIGVILDRILQKSEGSFVVLGCSHKYIRKLKEKQKARTVPQEAAPLHKKIQEIEAKNTKRRKIEIYSEGSCVFASEHGFLLDLLMGNVSLEGMRVIYVISDRFKLPCRNIMDFILFSASSSLSIFCEWSPAYMTCDLISKRYFPSSSIFLYPSFRKSVAKSLGDFEVGETALEIDPRREGIQAEVLYLIQKIERLPCKREFEKYICQTVKALKFSLSILYNSEVEKFIEYFRALASIDETMAALATLYGTSDSVYARNIVYRDALLWLALPNVEVIKEMSNELKKEEAVPPKKAEILRLIQRLEEKGEKMLLFYEGPKERPFECAHPLHRSSSFSRTLHRFVQENPEEKALRIVLVNFSVRFLRQIKLCRNRWARRGVEISLSLIQIKGSLEELTRLEEIDSEKNCFVHGIGAKQNMPENPDKVVFQMRAADSKAPTLQIDVREIRSDLPLKLSMMFCGKYNFEFSTLKVGDYVLNRAYFIERKRIDDFIGSLQSGRLFKQLKALEYIKGTSYLLIEFAETDRISFVKYTSRMQEVDLTGKIVNLLLTMRSTYIFYSSASLHSSALIHALARKPPSELERHVQCSPEVIEALMCIPGVDHRNVNLILSNFANMHELVTSEQEKLASVLGEETGRKAYHFFNEKA
ncbi:DNA excision repair protein ERCC-4 [Nematocida major]|uniref:DNA excision repair protein ERCC-4 n=1 Tax=Nematocida major TaxID=1912982 RepID=UPI002007DC2A|nr:DNA excision repair protein ERCC-4 [Nematocida major]KAH9385321.1 DNA excision repair protein ERCC-4 [Nematocida major]